MKNIIRQKLNQLKTHPFLIVSAVLWLSFSASMLLLYKVEWETAANRPQVAYASGDISNTADCLYLKKGDNISQEILVENQELAGFSLYFENNEKTPKSTFEIILSYQNGEEIKRWEYLFNEASRGNYFEFLLDEPVNIMNSEMLLVEIVVKDVDKGSEELFLNKSEDSSVLVSKEGVEKGIIPYRILSGDHSNLNTFLWFIYIMMTGLMLLVYFAFAKKVRLEWAFVAITAVLGIVYLFVLPPYVVPDEPSHFVTVYMQSSKLLDKPATDENGNIYVSSDTLWGHDKTEPNLDMYLQYFEGAFGQGHANNKEILTRTSLKSMHPGYIPQILGVTIAREFSLNAEQILLLGRIFALIWYCFIMYWAIRLMPLKKIMLFIIGILPMTMQQVVSYNYDSFLFGACFFAIAYLLYLIYEKDRIELKDWVIIALVAISIASIKFVYLPILTLALFIPREKFGKTRTKVIGGTFVLLLSLITLGLTSLLSVLRVSGVLMSSAVSESDLTQSSLVSLAYCIQNPVRILAVFYRTVERNFTYYFNGMLTSPLGWLDIPIPEIIMVLFAIVLAFSIFNTQQCEKQVSVKLKCAIGCACAATMGMIGFALLFDSTPEDAGTIWGIQGRYFTPVLPLLMLLLQNGLVSLRQNVDRYLVIITAYLHCFTVYFIMLNTISR